MEDKRLLKQACREIEAEAAVLEKKVEENEELAHLTMPDGSYEELKERIAASEKAKPKQFHIHKRPLLAVALIAILTLGTSIGVTGAKLFVPKVENRGEDGELRVAIDSNSEDVTYLKDVTEEEAYEEIEEKLGILALRLADKPQGMELGKVFIDQEMGEASMEFYYGDNVLTIYENKQYEDASTGFQSDGEVKDTVELFYLGQNVEIKEIDRGDGHLFYRIQLEYGNAYYYVIGDMELEEFENILMGIIFKTM